MMARPPPITLAPLFPVTTLVCGAAVVVSLSQMMGRSIDLFTIDDRVYWAQPWRLISCAFPHGSPAHLLFNLYWCWTLGAVAEHILGHWRTALLVLIVAAGSSAAEYAFAVGGIGLSGVVYGLFGALWMLQRHVPKLRGIIDKSTIGVFIAWFFICIITTKLGWMNVANFAHGAGLLLGVLMGIAYAGPPWKRALGWTGGIGLTVLFILCGWLWRNQVNLNWKDNLIRRAYTLLDAGRMDEALPLMREAWLADPSDADMAHDYALTSYQRGRTADTIAVLDRYATEHGTNHDLSQSAAVFASLSLPMDRFDSLALADTAVKLDPQSSFAWEVLGAARWRLWDPWGAAEALENAIDADPANQAARSRLHWMRTEGAGSEGGDL